MQSTKEIHIIGGGTSFHIRPHLAISAPAYGTTAKNLFEIYKALGVSSDEIFVHLTKMAGGTKLETNNDIEKLVKNLVEDPKPKIIFMSVALCDYKANVLKELEQEKTFISTASGKKQPRLKTNEGNKKLLLIPAEKIIGRIRKYRKDIFLVGFKTTTGETVENQFKIGMSLLKKNSCNLVLANDVFTRHNMILTPEMASYGNSSNRIEVLTELAKMTLARSTNNFVRTNVVTETPISWDQANSSLKTVVEHCVKAGAYKPFNGKTVGHFGQLLSSNILLSSRRKQNYNEPSGLNLAKVTFKNSSVESVGGKPSAGVRSQYELLKKFPKYDCVIHFHCPLKTEGIIPIKPQKYFECGSLQCGYNTSSGIKEFLSHGSIGAVMLDKHGPNILFHSSNDPQQVIKFIEKHFDLTKRTR